MTVQHTAVASDVPLSFAQQRLWFLDRRQPGSPAYVITGAFRITGPLSVPVLERTLSEIVARHEALRTVFPEHAGQPHQVVTDPKPITLAVEDLVSSADIHADVRAVIDTESTTPFDLDRGPVLRARLLRLAERGHLLVLTVHHIAMDGWSMGILWQELTILYRETAAGRPSPLPPLPEQYADYSLWQRRRFNGDAAERQIEYWRNQLRDAPELELPTDRPRPPAPSPAGDSVGLRIDPAVTTRLKQVGQAANATLFMTTLAAFQLLVGRYATEEDVVVAVVSANRVRRQTRRLIGFFANTLVIRTSLAEEPTFAELLDRVRATCLSAFSHQDVPFERVVEELAPPREANRNPLAQILFQLQQFDFKTAPPTDSDDEVVIERFALDAGAGSKFDLSLAMAEIHGELRGRLTFSTDLFDRATAERFAGHFRTLLDRLSQHPDVPVSQIDILTPEEHRRFVDELNDTAVDITAVPTIDAVVARHAASDPDAVALVDVDSRPCSRAELDARVCRIAAWLRSAGEGPGSVVGLVLRRDAALIAATLAVMRIGAAHVPIAPDQPPDRARVMLADAGVDLTLASPDLAAGLATAGLDGVVPLDRAVQEAEDFPAAAVPSAATPDSLAYIMYTSGSTGTPKGVEVVHRQLINYFAWLQDEFSFGDGRGAPLHATTAYAGTLSGLFGPLVAGRPLWLVPGDDTFGLGPFLAGHGDFSLLKLTPSKLELVSSQLSDDQLRNRTRVLMLGGEPLVRTPALERWLAASPTTTVVNQYGSTECVGCCIHVLDDTTEPGKATPIGRPIANSRVYVLDGHRRVVPIGVIGELWVGGYVIARGYRGQPGLTADHFVSDPFSDDPESRLFRTGDLARYRVDGTVELVGRSDDQVKVRGHRVECGEVEAVLRVHPAVDDAVVLQREAGTGLTAYVVAPALSGHTEELVAHARARLPSHMVPDSIVMLDRLPLNAHGKLDRAALPSPEVVAPRPVLRPATPVEEKLLAIWRQVLEREDVGLDDNFFDLGGDSFSSVQIAALAQDQGLAVEVTDVFEYQSVAELSRAADAAG